MGLSQWSISGLDTPGGLSSCWFSVTEYPGRATFQVQLAKCWSQEGWFVERQVDLNNFQGAFPILECSDVVLKVPV